MTDREKLIKLLEEPPVDFGGNRHVVTIADYLIANGVTVQKPARPLEEWNEDCGDVLWWVFPVEEPPYVGSPLDADWPGYHTHWTSLPPPPKEDK